MDKRTTSRGAETVLITVAHSDDETLGAGGTLARHVKAGDRVFGLSLTDGVGARTSAEMSDSIDRAAAAKRAAAVIGFQWLEPGDFPDNEMDRVSLLSIVRVLEKAKAETRPTIVYTHSPADLNIDHRLVCEAVLTAFRPQPGETCREIRTIEIPSATDFGHPSVTGVFRPNLFVDISAHWDVKKAALECYRTEMRAAPHSRSLEGVRNLACLRGNQVGLDMAEAFEVLRKIEA